jgi:RNA polymerase sigma-70 factor (ECF subfamily)
VGRDAAGRIRRQGGGPPAPAGPALTGTYEEIFRAHWRTAVAVAVRQCGDLGLAQDAAQDACALALEKWPAEGVPGRPGAWLAGVARHKALDRVRRESRRPGKEAAAVRGLAGDEVAGPAERAEPAADADELGLVFMCCHPSLDEAARVALTLRCVCGVATADIASAFLVPEQTMAQRIVRAKRKIRQAGIRLSVPAAADLPGRLAGVLRVIYLVFNAGYLATSGPELIRGDLCDHAVGLARAVTGLLPGEPEAAGLLALLLLTDARRPARVGPDGELVVLADQDRSRWNRELVAEGERLLVAALRAGRPGLYQVHAAIAACHSCAATLPETDWRQIAALYGELLKYEPTSVTEANRAVAVAMAEGAGAGLAVLDGLRADPRLTRWPQFHIARAELLTRLGRTTQAAAAYDAALALAMPAPERAHVERRREELPGG